LNEKNRKIIKKAMKTFFYEQVHFDLKHIFNTKYNRWKKLIVTAKTKTNTKIHIPIKKITRILLLVISRLKFTALSARGSIKWNTFWTFSCYASEIMKKSHEFLDNNWLSRIMILIENYSPNNIREILMNTEKYNKLSVTYILISTKSKHAYVGESSQAYTRYKTEITCGKNSHLSHNGPGYQVRLAKSINKIGFANWAVFPIIIHPSNSLLERKRSEKYFINKIRPNLNTRIFQHNHFKKSIDKKPRPLIKWRKLKARKTFCTCSYTSGRICGEDCWLIHEWKTQKQNTSLTRYYIRERTPAGNKYYMGLALDILLRPFTPGTEIKIKSYKGKHDLTNFTILLQDWGPSELQSTKGTLNDLQKHTRKNDRYPTNMILKIQLSKHLNDTIIKNLTELAFKPHKWRNILRKCTQNTLFDLFYRAESIENRKILQRTRHRLATYIFSRFGIKNMNNLNCAFTFSEKIDKHTIKTIINICTKKITDVSDNILNGLKNTIRITTKNRRSISQILVNNKNTNREYDCIKHTQ